MYVNTESPVVVLNHGCIKFNMTNKNIGTASFAFYPSGDVESTPSITLYRNQFSKLLTCLKLNFDAIVSQAQECHKEYCNKDNFPNFDNKYEEEEEVLDQQMLAEYGHTSYIPGRVILKSSIFKGRLRLWVVKQWLKRPDYVEKFVPDPDTSFVHMDEIAQPNWLACKGAFCIDPLKKELSNLLVFHNKVANIIKLIQHEQQGNKPYYNKRKSAMEGEGSSSTFKASKKMKKMPEATNTVSDTEEEDTGDNQEEGEDEEGKKEAKEEVQVQTEQESKEGEEEEEVDFANLPSTQAMDWNNSKKTLCVYYYWILFT